MIGSEFMKKYNNRWLAKSMTINFNHKIWRQDFAAFVRRNLFWDVAFVSRSRAVDRNGSIYEKGKKEFEVYDGYGRNVGVVYENGNKVILTSHPALIEEYFKLRGMVK